MGRRRRGGDCRASLPLPAIPSSASPETPTTPPAMRVESASRTHFRMESEEAKGIFVTLTSFHMTIPGCIVYVKCSLFWETGRSLGTLVTVLQVPTQLTERAAVNENRLTECELSLHFLYKG